MTADTLGEVILFTTRSRSAKNHLPIAQLMSQIHIAPPIVRLMPQRHVAARIARLLPPRHVTAAPTARVMPRRKIPKSRRMLRYLRRIKPNCLEKRALETQQRKQALPEDRLKDLHHPLNTCPDKDERAQDPSGLKVSLMPHQQHALAWLIWREMQKPHGGILADDMGLGKTLAMISLILSAPENHDPDERDNERYNTKGGSLVVCPASVLNQWSTEIPTCVKLGKLKVELFHGTSRESIARRLAQNHVVITTYNSLVSEHRSASDSVLDKINWERVILDEAHAVRNHKSQTLEAVFGL